VLNLGFRIAHPHPSNAPASAAVFRKCCEKTHYYQNEAEFEQCFSILGAPTTVPHFLFPTKKTTNTKEKMDTDKVSQPLNAASYAGMHKLDCPQTET
jgi:hypothetical protein